MDGSVEDRHAGVKLDRMYQITPSAVVQSEERPRLWQQSCHNRFKRDQAAAQALCGDALRHLNHSCPRIQARIGAGGVFLCRRSHSKMTDNRISFLLPV